MLNTVKRWVSLVELLVVMIIIAVLSVIAFLSFKTDIVSPDKIAPKSKLLTSILSQNYNMMRASSDYTAVQRDLGKNIADTVGDKTVASDIVAECRADNLLNTLGKGAICNAINDLVIIGAKWDISVKEVSFDKVKAGLLSDVGTPKNIAENFDNATNGLAICFENDSGVANQKWICSVSMYTEWVNYEGYAADALKN